MFWNTLWTAHGVDKAVLFANGSLHFEGNFTDTASLKYSEYIVQSSSSAGKKKKKMSV